MPTLFAAPTLSHRIKQTDTYFLYKKRPEPHIHVVVTPPEKRGKKNQVLVEVYNRTKEPLSIVLFDITFLNHAALEISSKVEASDLAPNLSGAQWIDLGKMGKEFPTIDSARLDGLQVVDKKANKREVKVYLDLIKE